MKEYVPLPLVTEAKQLLEEEIRSQEGLHEPDFAGIHGGTDVHVCIVCVVVCVCVGVFWYHRP